MKISLFYFIVINASKQRNAMCSSLKSFALSLAVIWNIRQVNTMRWIIKNDKQWSCTWKRQVVASLFTDPLFFSSKLKAAGDLFMTVSAYFSFSRSALADVFDKSEKKHKTTPSVYRLTIFIDFDFYLLATPGSNYTRNWGYFERAADLSREKLGKIKKTWPISAFRGRL